MYPFQVPIIGDEKKVATVFLTNKDDVESSVLVEDGNSGRRKSACLTCITELCALLVVALIILCTALLLVRLWGVVSGCVLKWNLLVLLGLS